MSVVILSMLALGDSYGIMQMVGLLIMMRLLSIMMMSTIVGLDFD